MRQAADFVVEFYQFFILPFLSIAIFYAMEYISQGAQFFTNEKGVKWRFLSFCALMQFFVSIVIILSVKAVFESDPLLEYKTMKMVAIILLGTTPFNISILIWVAIKLEIYKLMRNRYEKEMQEAIHTDSMLHDLMKTSPKNAHTTQKETKEETITQTQNTQETNMQKAHSPKTSHTQAQAQQAHTNPHQTQE